ncbi:MAG: calcium/sodium antiporter [Methanomethylophilus sp.]|jgi:cation:H+ antiporter|nr:calcium/sodium antiporter [Methanomethylophilus sp.]
MEWVLLGIPLGIVMLYFGSDWLVKGAKNLALRLGVAPFVVGLTVVAFGSSAPEMVTSVVSANTPAIILGNVLGSNIVNIGIAIALAAIVCPLAAKYDTMRMEVAMMIITSFAVFILAALNILSLWVGIGLIAALIIFLYVIYRAKKDNTEGQEAYTSEVEEGSTQGYPILIALIAVGLILLYFGARFFVDGAVELAHMIGISDLLVGLIIVAIGTSLPEICICLIAASRGENDLAVANIVGSNIFNACAVLGIGAVVAKIPVSESVLYFHIPVMILISLCMFAMIKWKNQISRPSAFVLLGIYVAYLAIMIAVPSLAI